MGYLPPVKITCNPTTVRMDACKQHAITMGMISILFEKRERWVRELKNCFSFLYIPMPSSAIGATGIKYNLNLTYPWNCVWKFPGRSRQALAKMMCTIQLLLGRMLTNRMPFLQKKIEFWDRIKI